ncbi:30S ribosomal protein S15 [Patescibacteria group bacterium]|nr:30S ribosomal protein S15 [Patescibacteria group bacterium]
MKRDKKKAVIEKNGRHAKDTGSPEVQVAVLTERITELTVHLETHPKDNHSKTGLLKLVGRRRKLLDFLKKKDKKSYEDLIGKLNIRK